ncbi:TPA: CocE/NonD family hydrolase [Klebsiella oxytoca]
MKVIDTKIYGHDTFPVYYRKALSPTAPRARYPGFKPEKLLLKKGSIRREGARPLLCDIVFERDVALQMRDGITIYTDIFRPADENMHPALVAWSPYGKEIGGQWLDDIYDRSGVPLEWVSELQKFEGPDPAFWVEKGYVVLNPDPRGAYQSEGNINYWGRQLAEDGYDFIEWAARQSWSNGKVGMAGNSWLAVSQWFIAAEQPPHLQAIAPWEGFVDHFRDTGNRGGIPAPAFPEAIIKTFASKNWVEDQPRMIVENQLFNVYWEDKSARLENINVPAYVVASYTNPAHTHGSFEGFRRIKSENKWLRVNNTNEWEDFYTPLYSNELLKFFDRYLKNEPNDWENTPRVRICVLDDGGIDSVNRVVKDWPVPDCHFEKLYLNGCSQLLFTPEPLENAVSYNVASDSKVLFRHVFEKDTTIIGYMKLHLWVEADGSDDMELEVSVLKHDPNGKPYLRPLGEGMTGPAVARGLLRVSQRKLDLERSTPSEPYLLHTQEEKLKAGEIVAIDIGLWPMAMNYHAGEQLVLTIAPCFPIPTSFDMGFGTAMLEIPESGGTFTPGESVPMLNLGGTATLPASPKLANETQVETPISRNKGRHVIYFGNNYDSYLLIPIT